MSEPAEKRHRRYSKTGLYAKSETGKRTLQLRHRTVEMLVEQLRPQMPWLQASDENALKTYAETRVLCEIGEAIISVEQALQMNAEEVIFHPLALTLRGELRLQSDEAGRARFETSEQDFRDAIRIARRISAKSLELRATMSLARLLASQSHGDEARVMLAEIYGWFTEGFDTTDLKDAKAPLDELTV
jgi:hypothetical protein